MPKFPPVLVAIVTALAALQPAVSALSGVIPPTWLYWLTAGVSLAGALHLWLSVPTAADVALRARVEHAAARADAPHTKALMAHLLGGAALLCLLAAGCTPAEQRIVSAIEQDAPIACEAMQGLDPAVMSVVCAIVDDLDGVLVPLTPVLAPSDAARAFVAKHPALSDVRARFLARRVDAAVKGVGR